MSITTIIRVPEVGEVGVEARFFAPNIDTGNEVRFYLTRAPANSALVTLDKLAELPQIPAPDKSKARLKVRDDSYHSFVPDVPGHYEVEAHEVTVTTAVRRYADAPNLPDTDNDFAGATVVTLSTADAIGRYDGQADYQVIQTVSRTIGLAPNTLTVALRSRDVTETLLSDVITFTASSSAVAKLAQYDDSVIGVRDLLKEGRIRDNARHFMGQAVMQATLLDELIAALYRWNDHINQASVCNIHAVADTTNTVPSATVTTLAECLARLAALRMAYNAHRVSTTFHPTSDTTNAFKAALANPTDLPTGLNFARVAFQVMVFGAAESVPLTNDSAFLVNGHMMRWTHVSPGINDPISAASFDFSSTLFGLARATNQLTALYNAHRVRVSQSAAHSASDGGAGGNGVSSNISFSVAAIVTQVNAWASAIERHTADQDGTGTKRVSPIHFNTRPVAIGQRAHDLSTAVSTFELCCAALERHALDGGDGAGAHAVPIWGRQQGGLPGGPWSAFTRLQLHWSRLQDGNALLPPPGYNALPTTLVGLGWK